MVAHFFTYAEVAHLVEHDLAKVGVAGSSPVFRSKSSCPVGGGFFVRTQRPGGGIGRHAGLKILWPAMALTVQLRSGAQNKSDSTSLLSFMYFFIFFIQKNVTDIISGILNARLLRT
jgi:hypothetical protein